MVKIIAEQTLPLNAGKNHFGYTKSKMTSNKKLITTKAKK
jgi:hypothetical protein